MCPQLRLGQTQPPAFLLGMPHLMAAVALPCVVHKDLLYQVVRGGKRIGQRLVLLRVTQFGPPLT